MQKEKKKTCAMNQLKTFQNAKKAHKIRNDDERKSK